MIVRGKRGRLRQTLIGAGMLAPSLLLFGTFVGLPALRAFRVSLYEWTGFSPRSEYVGLRHFRLLFGETAFATAPLFALACGLALLAGWQLGRRRVNHRIGLLGRRINRNWAWAPILTVLAVWLLWWLYAVRDGDGFFRACVRNNFRYMILGGVFHFVFAFVFAAALNLPRFRGAKFYRTMIFFPSFISAVGVAILWQRIYDVRYGLLNGLLQGAANLVSRILSPITGAFGGEPVRLLIEPIEWLSGDNMFNSIIAAGVWAGVGSQMILLVAGMQRIPPSYYEAARVDGASERRVFFNITIPMMREVILITLTLWVIGALKVFGLVQAMSITHDEKSSVISVRQYELAFSNRDNIYQMGYATAMTVVLLVLIVVLALGLRLLRGEDELEY